jgi:hypothetical protein
MSTPPNKPAAPGSQKKSEFSLDRDTTGMSVPSVTQLLNRKSFTREIERSRSKSPAPIPPAPKDATHIQTQSQTAPTPPPMQATRSITQVPAVADPNGQVFKQTTEPERQKGLVSIQAWSDVDLAQLSGCEALMPLFSEGQKSNLWSRVLILLKNNEQSYLARKAWGPSDAALLWDGLTLRPTQNSMLMSHLQRSGGHDLPAVASEALNQEESRVLREALGAQHEESVLIVRLGPPSNPWGIACWVTHPKSQARLPTSAPLSTWAQKWISELNKAAPPKS